MTYSFSNGIEHITRKKLSLAIRYLVLSLIACGGSWLVFQFIGAPALAKYEEPKYETILNGEDFEIRKYSKKIAAEVELEGDQRSVMNKGFRILASYIFGKNISQEKIAMTSPVVSQPSTKIPMTSPVTVFGGDRLWRVTFYMPSEYNLQSLPKPIDKRISISEVPGETYAVIKFSGRWNSESFENKKTKLKSLLKEQNVEITGKPINAYYDPPFTLPMFRRNEVMIPVSLESVLKSSPQSEHESLDSHS